MESRSESKDPTMIRGQSGRCDGQNRWAFADIAFDFT